MLQIVGARLLPFTPIPVRSESRSKALNSLLAALTTQYAPPSTYYHLVRLLGIPTHPVIMLKKKLLSILTNYLTDANYMHLERNKLRSTGPPPLYQGAKRRLATEADHTTQGYPFLAACNLTHSLGS